MLLSCAILASLHGILIPRSTAAPAGETSVEKPASTGTSRALIIASIPGDDEHEEQFARIIKDWQTSLTQSMDFAAADVHVLFGKQSREGLGKPATRENFEKEIAELSQTLKPADRLWVFFVGHANYDAEHAYFHLAGRDFSADELAKHFAALRCREQVFWLTTPASGWFMKAFSTKGRIVIAATLADDEYNETEFPEAFAAVLKRPRAELDTNHDGKVSILELYDLIVAEVNARFAKDKRIPTEHAQLDDNGDGHGTEKPTEKPGDTKAKGDGAVAAKTYVPFKRSG
ncbi:MAG TPA: hypothetical protein VGY58_02650 [Gemmataceae bacterium]|jgi:hypothetical protein|nr:hypothetical protein [Gemmataceae bacterium]